MSEPTSYPNQMPRAISKMTDLRCRCLDRPANRAFAGANQDVASLQVTKLASVRQSLQTSTVVIIKESFMKFWLILAALAIVPGDALAACECVCPNGAVKAICTSQADRPPASCNQSACASSQSTVFESNQSSANSGGCQMVLVTTAPGGPFEWMQACR